MEMESSLKEYAETLKKRARLYLLSDFERLLNLLKDTLRLLRPSKQRDKEFIEIYFRLFKCLILFRDAQGRVTVESISNAQRMLNEIRTISENAELGWNNGSKLHHDLPGWVDSLGKKIDDIKQLIEQANVMDEKNNVEEGLKLQQMQAKLRTQNEPGPSTRFSPRR